MNRKSLLFRVLPLALFLFTISFLGAKVHAQVTSSAITGRVTDSKGSELPGATVVAIHVPSGSKYGSITNELGRYNIPAIRVGGPYTVTVSFVGFKDQSQENITANLGTTANVDFGLSEEGTQLSEVVITGAGNGIFSSDRMGASTTLGLSALNNLPTLGRSVNDITKYNAYSNGRSFGGQDNRLNNFTIDGASFNNGFGLGNQAQAGGRTGSGAISLDALEEVQINIAPFDVRQSGFAGAGINAVTRSGTNTFSGSVFGFLKNQDLIGKKAADGKVAVKDFSEKTYGFRVGGPIIKNKLFFFANGEIVDRSSPALDWVASRPGVTAGNASRVLAADLDQLSKFMKDNFDYNTGPYDQFNNESTSKKFLVRLDYNINSVHKLSLRYAHHDSQSDQIISNSRTAGNGNRTNLADALSFQNSGYIIVDNTRSLVAELNSNFNGKFSNTLIATFNKQIEDRKYRTAPFPTVDILKDGKTYTAVGFDPFTPSNKLNYSTMNITNNLTYFAGKHTLTFGVSAEYFKSNNLFFFASNGVYSYNSLEDFYNAALEYKNNPSLTTTAYPARTFTYRYSTLPNNADPWQSLEVMKYAAYVQDEFQVKNNFKVVAGLRADLITFGNVSQAFENQFVSSLTFQKEGSPYRVNTATLPKSKVLFSPRIGFNWDVKDNKMTQVRGGTGIFVSSLPYVWISNQLGNNNVLIGTISGANSADYPFTTDPTKFRPANIDVSKVQGTINATDPAFKFPQIWKSNLAIDQKLPWGMIGTVEGLYNKSLQAIKMLDVNAANTTTRFSGPDTRELFPGGQANFINPTLGTNARALVLTNTKKGYAYSLTAKVEKPVSKGFGGMVGYTYAKAKDLTALSSTAAEAYQIPTTSYGNNLGLGWSNNDLRHRVVGYLNYRIQYGKGAGGASMFTLGMVSNSGSKISYIYGNDMNNDGVTGNDLIFVPNKGSDLTFAPLTSNGVTFSPEEQAVALDKYIQGNDYLKTRRGTYAERNGGYYPWLTRFDFTFQQDFYVNVGKSKNIIRLRADIFNVGNMLNKKWGVGNASTTTLPLTRSAIENGVPVYTLATQSVNGQTQLVKDSFVKSLTLDDVWQAQVGIRYIFN